MRRKNERQFVKSLNQGTFGRELQEGKGKVRAKEKDEYRAPPSRWQPVLLANCLMLVVVVLELLFGMTKFFYLHPLIIINKVAFVQDSSLKRIKVLCIGDC